MGAAAECCVVVESLVAAPFVVVEPEFAFELAVVELDAPAQAGEAGEPLAVFGFGEGGEPVVARGPPRRRAIR